MGTEHSERSSGSISVNHGGQQGSLSVFKAFLKSFPLHIPTNFSIYLGSTQKRLPTSSWQPGDLSELPDNKDQPLEEDGWFGGWPLTLYPLKSLPPSPLQVPPPNAQKYPNVKLASLEKKLLFYLYIIEFYCSPDSWTIKLTVARTPSYVLVVVIKVPPWKALYPAQPIPWIGGTGGNHDTSFLRRARGPLLQRWPAKKTTTPIIPRAAPKWSFCQ